MRLERILHRLFSGHVNLGRVTRLAPAKLEEIKLALLSSDMNSVLEHVMLLVTEVDRCSALFRAIYETLDDTLDDESGMNGTEPEDAIEQAKDLLQAER